MSRVSRSAAFGFGFSGILAGTVMIACSRGASIEIDPDLMHFGSFSTTNPTESDPTPGSTAIVIESDVDWRLHTIIREPVRRTSDGLELPVERISELWPDVPDEIINRKPFVVTSGLGSDVPKKCVIDWKIIEDAIQSYLRPGDPPGNYETTIEVRLLERDGEGVLAGPEIVVAEFALGRWADFQDDIGQLEIMVEGGSGIGSIGPALIGVASNSGWEMSVTASGDLVREDGDGYLAIDTMSIEIADEYGFGDWYSLQQDPVALQTETIALARGMEPEPFTNEANGVPILLHFRSQEAPRAGVYRTTLSFSLVTNSLPGY